jgi:succinoglycan biosynthesis protein ExoM
MHASVCVCTHRRPVGLRALLAGLASQRLPEPATVDFVVVDNEGSEDARRACEAFAASAPGAVRYVLELRRGIPLARNAGLAALSPRCDFFAMIDDDEVPADDWLAALLRAQRETDADVVQGAVVPVLPDATPEWIRARRFFSWPPDPFDEEPPPRDRQPLRSAATNNVLVRAALVRELGLRFDERVGLRGFDDALFFRTLRAHGARLVYAADARVCEIVPPERARLGHLVRVQYRQGQKKLAIKRLSTQSDARPAQRIRLALRTAGRGAGRIGAGLAAASAAALRSAARRRPDAPGLALGLLRAAEGVGMVIGAAGGRYEHYR